MVLNILLTIEIMLLLDLYALFYLKWKDTYNILKDIRMKFHNKSVYDEKYIKAKVKTFNGVVYNILEWWNSKRKCMLHLHSSNMYWSVTNTIKKDYPQVY